MPARATILRTLLTLAAGTALLFGAEPPLPEEPSLPEEPAADQEQSSPKDTAIERLLSERESPQAFDQAVANARKHEVPEQAILEARFLFHVDRHEDSAIVGLLPDFLKRRDSFEVKDSAIFAFKEDWLAVIEYAQALEALAKGDKAAFKQHITEAFWLSPGQGAAFAPHIERLRIEEAMRDTRLDFQTELAGLLAPGPVKLASLMAEGRKALLLHFWSPWARECEDTIGDFAATARLLDKHRISVVSILAEDAPGLLEDARKLVAEMPQGTPCQWLLDRQQQPLSALFRVQTLPVVVLVQPDGRVLFNGEPGDDKLWKQLRTIDPQLERPRVDTTPSDPQVDR